MDKEWLSPGTFLDQGRFEVTRAIKAGGMGAVYEVVDHRLGGKQFALKEMINPGLDMEGQHNARERFISEIQVMMTLKHPNIPKVTAQFLHGKSFYFVMQLVRGIDLSQKLKRDGDPGLPPGLVVGWALQILSALEHLHKRPQPVVHRDIKPSNILLDEDTGHIALIDFGISAASNPGEGLWIGTPGYAPPEQQWGKPEPKSDLYALGATMHYLLSGIKPKNDFEFEDLKVDAQLNKAIKAALASWTDERVASAEAMAESLRNLKNIQVDMPTMGDQDFDGAVDTYKNEVLDPSLKELISRYGNECHTRFLPQNLDYMQFVLASPTPFELQITKDENRSVVAFREKQGILDARLLGEVDPASSDRAQKTQEILTQYVQDYEESKGWGVAF